MTMTQVVKDRLNVMRTLQEIGTPVVTKHTEQWAIFDFMHNSAQIIFSITCFQATTSYLNKVQAATCIIFTASSESIYIFNPGNASLSRI